MKKLIPCLMCVVFLLVAISINPVYAYIPETIEFSYNGKIFNYNLQENIKQSSVFDINYEINKYKRFSTKEERVTLLKHMVNIGIEKSIALDYIFPNLNKKINQIEKNISVVAKDADLKINSNKQNVFNIIPEVVGINLNKNKLINDIYNNYINNKEMKFDIPFTKTQPTITKESFAKFTNLRGDFSTDISSSSKDRKHNIKNALISLNKTTILPNETFSFNKTVGKRTAENGYRNAKIIVNNEFVEGVGGGVCQVSSTLYNSALLAGLEILEANKHSKQVQYVNYGFDAMVNFGSSDLKFKNNTNEKIIIITNFTSNKIRIRIYGENLKNTSYKLTNEIFNIHQPSEEILFDENQAYLDKITYEDEFFYLKKGNVGMDIKSYREKYENNILVNKEILRHDKYTVQNTIKVFGTKKRTEELCV